MDDKVLLQLLEEVLFRMGVTIRIESMPDESWIAGGLCVIRGKREIIISPRATTTDQVQVLVNALRRMDTESIWLPPVVRQLLQQAERE